MDRPCHPLRNRRASWTTEFTWHPMDLLLLVKNPLQARWEPPRGDRLSSKWKGVIDRGALAKNSGPGSGPLWPGTLDCAASKSQYQTRQEIESSIWLLVSTWSVLFYPPSFFFLILLFYLDLNIITSWVLIISGSMEETKSLTDREKTGVLACVWLLLFVRSFWRAEKSNPVGWDGVTPKPFSLEIVLFR